jgi:hypothetical protein
VIARWVFFPIAIVSAAGLGVELWHAWHPDATSDLLVPRLSLSYEANVPTWLSSSLLLLCAVAAGAIAREAKQRRVAWWGIAAALGYVSLDEAIELHEHLGGLVGTNGVLYFDWIVIAAPIVAVLAVVYWPFLRDLPAVTRRRLIIAAVVYVGGALVMEMPLGLVAEQGAVDTLRYAVIDWVEETMEMIGAGLALVALVAYRQERT